MSTMKKLSLNTSLFSNLFNEYTDSNENYDILDNDSTDFATESLLSESVTTESTANESADCDIEIQPFLWDEIEFNKARALANKDVEDDELFWKSVANSEEASSEFGSTTTSSTGESEENAYLIENADGSNINSSRILTPCVVLDMIDGQIQCCSKTKNLRPLAQLIGTWEIDKESFLKVNVENKLHTLGVCTSHFTFDQNSLHSPNIKQIRSVEKSWINYRRCLFCNKYKYFFSRGKNCVQHSMCIIGRNVQVPCIGLKVCSVFTTGEDQTSDVIHESNDEHRTRYVCSECFTLQGGHFFERQGSGKKPAFSCQDRHNNDATEGLKLLGQWILNVAETGKKNQKEELLTWLGLTLSVFNKSASCPTNLPSLFLIRTALRLGQVNLTKVTDQSYNFTLEASTKVGEALGVATWKSRHEIQKNKQKLEKPTSLEEYQHGFPSCLAGFFNGFITALQKKKYEVVTKKRIQRGLQVKAFDTIRVTKIVVFLISVILNIAFPGTNIWLTHIMSSLCRKPKLLSSLYAILCTANVVSHTQCYERRLEKIRTSEVTPEDRLIRSENIWNLSVIDNIDFVEKTYAYGNIFDANRNTLHATLRMVFQFTFPQSLQSIFNTDTNHSTLSLFGESIFTNNLIRNYEKDLLEFLETRSMNWDADDFLEQVACKVQIGCQVPPPNIVILRPGNNPNCDANVHEACEMYFDDVGIENSGYLDVACDEAIFRRLIPYQDNHNEVRIFLGQWHTSKDMCSALITIFSGYGIFNLAASLGVIYLDKLEKVVDYPATCRVLELIWVAVGIAISQHLRGKNESMDHIETGNNQVLKVWYHYFRWAGYWIGHKIGIRRGNYDMQFKNLSAFSPLFPVAGKSNYARSVTHFLSYVNDDPQLRELLQHVCSVNLTRSGHFFGFDEALERFGVMFVKQNIGRRLINSEELKSQITSVQAERDRLDLLISEYLGDIVINREDRAVKSRKESLWKLATELTDAFALSDPATHKLFQDTRETNKEGFQRLFSCYDLGIARLNTILRQDVHKTEIRNVKGRRARNVVSYKLQSLQAITRDNNRGRGRGKGRAQNNTINTNKIVENLPTPENLDVNVGEASSSSSNRKHSRSESDESIGILNPYPTKKCRRQTTEEEKKILEAILDYSIFPEDQVFSILHQLQDESPGWNKTRVRTYWNNHKRGKKSANSENYEIQDINEE